MIGAIIAKKKVRSAFDALSRQNLDAFLAQWAEDATFIYPGGTVEGKEAVREWYQKFLDQFPLTSFTVKNICVQRICPIAVSNVVTAEWDLKLNNRDGEEFDNSGVTVINLKKGKAILVRNYTSDPEVEKRIWGELGQG